MTALPPSGKRGDAFAVVVLISLGIITLYELIGLPT